MMSRVSRDRLGLIEAWNAAPLPVRESDREILRRIGGSPPDLTGVRAGALNFPCRVVSTDGIAFDPAIIHLSSWAPYYHHVGRSHLLSEVKEIEKSDFALSRGIRYASNHVGEVAMGFAPLAVRARDGNRFTLNSPMDVFSQGAYKGCDMEPDPKGFNHRDYGRIVNQNLDQIDYFFGDYPELDDGLRLTEDDA
jgi:hypothetical protein